MRPELVLASGSPARLALLRGAGLSAQVIVSGVNEDAEGSVSEIVAELACRKALHVAAQLQHGLVLGCDSLLEFGGTARGKPSSDEEALSWWSSIRGREAILRTGHFLIDVESGRSAAEVVSTTVIFGTPTDSELARYVATGEPAGVAGAFTLAGHSAPFIDGVVGDANNVEGLSLGALRRMLDTLGIAIVDLWTSPA